MVHDYSRRYSQVLQRRQPVARPAALRSWSLSRFLGSALLAVAVGGVGFSFWVGHRISTGLAELAAATAHHDDLVERHTRLVARRDELQAEPAVRRRAAALSLVWRYRRLQFSVRAEHVNNKQGQVTQKNNKVRAQLIRRF